MTLTFLLTASALAGGYVPSPPLDGRTQLALERLNALRADPPAFMDDYTAIVLDPMARGDCDEGPEILSPLLNYAPRPPLAPNTLLAQAATSHATDMVTRDYFDHTSPEGVGPNARIRAAGFPLDGKVRTPRGTYRYDDARDANQTESLFQTQRWRTDAAPALEDHQWADAMDNLVADACVEGRGHRDHLLGNNPLAEHDRLVGIGWYVGQDAGEPGWYGWKLAVAIETAVPADNTRYVLGVVWEDLNGSGSYDVGEGLPGVEVSSPELGIWTRTAAGGGYVLPLQRGAQGTLTAWGQSLDIPSGRDNLKRDVQVVPRHAQSRM